MICFDGDWGTGQAGEPNRFSLTPLLDKAVIFFLSCPPRLKDLLKTHGGNRDCLYYNRFGGEMFYSCLNVVFLSCIFYRAVLEAKRECNRRQHSRNHFGQHIRRRLLPHDLHKISDLQIIVICPAQSPQKILG